MAFNQTILKKRITVFTKLFSTMVFNIDLLKINVSWAANQHIRMISEGSCDTEDWSNDAENSALLSYTKKKYYYKEHSVHFFTVCI